jgi:hypothetical protein
VEVEGGAAGLKKLKKHEGAEMPKKVRTGTPAGAETAAATETETETATETETETETETATVLPSPSPAQRRDDLAKKVQQMQAQQVAERDMGRTKAADALEQKIAVAQEELDKLISNDHALKNLPLPWLPHNVMIIGEEGFETGQLCQPTDVCWSTANLIVVADGGNGRIQSFDITPLLSGRAEQEAEARAEGRESVQVEPGAKAEVCLEIDCGAYIRSLDLDVDGNMLAVSDHKIKVFGRDGALKHDNLLSGRTISTVDDVFVDPGSGLVVMTVKGDSFRALR